MADTFPGEVLTSAETSTTPDPPRTIEEARARARDRFKQRLVAGEQIGDCDCHSEEAETVPRPNEPSHKVVGVRFRDSGRTYYFDPRNHDLNTGDWVVVETGRGREAGRVVIAPHQIRMNQLQGELRPILRRLNHDDIERLETLKGESATAVKTFGREIRERVLPMKPISAEFNFDGSHLTLNYSSQERVDPRDLARDLANHFNCRVELKQVGPRDEARLLGGLGRCGRTLCCSSWLPVYPEISMGMAKTQDLSLNPTKVSGVCGRLLCCLSYENEQYKQMKAVLPRLGQIVETPQGPGMVVSLQVLKEMVTVRLGDTNQELAFSSADLGFGKPSPPATPPSSRPEPPTVTAELSDAADDENEPGESASEGQTGGSGSRRRRRRRRGGNRRSESGAEATP